MHRIPFLYANLPLMSLASKQKKQKVAWWTLGMTWFLLLLFTWETDGLNGFLHISKGFLKGDLATIRNLGSTTMLPTLTAIVVVLIPTMIAIALILERVSKQTENTFRLQSPERLFAVVMITLFCEELLARFLFLGLLPRIPKLDGDFFFYLFFLGGNILWAWIHLRNFENKRDRKLIMVLPQFVGGIFLTIIYVSHGFFAALGAHVIYDMVLFSANYRIKFSPSRFILSFYHLFFLGVYSLLFFKVRNHSFLEIKLALEKKGEEWAFIDYFSLVGVLTTATFLVLEVLWYDLERTPTRKEYMLNLVYTGPLMTVAYLVMKLTNSLFTGSLLVIALGLAIGITFLEKSMSESGVARLFWKSLLLTSVIDIMQATSIGTALLLLLPFLLQQSGERWIRLNSPFQRPIIYLDVKWKMICYAVRNGGKPLRTAIRVIVHQRVNPEALKIIQASRKYPKDLF
jgi:hypothetical protein